MDEKRSLDSLNISCLLLKQERQNVNRLLTKFKRKSIILRFLDEQCTLNFRFFSFFFTTFSELRYRMKSTFMILNGFKRKVDLFPIYLLNKYRELIDSGHNIWTIARS